MKEMKIRIDKNGRLHFDFNGYVGDECFQHREEIMKILRDRYGVDLEIEYEEKKPEAYVGETEVIKEGW